VSTGDARIPTPHFPICAPTDPCSASSTFAKPEDVYERIEALAPGHYLELFARERRLGWASWGQEVETGISERRWRADRYPNPLEETGQ